MSRPRIIRTPSEIEALKPLWNALISPQATLFQRFEWNLLAARVFAEREAPYVVVAETDAGACILPSAIAAASKNLTLLGEELFDYPDLLHEGDEEVLRQAWGELAELRLPFSVTALREDSRDPAWRMLPLSEFTAAPAVRASQIGSEAFATAHPRLGRSLRRLQKAGAEMRLYPGSASSLVRSIYVEKGRQLNGRPDNLFADPLRVEFMVAACALDPAACEIYTLECASTVVAALVTFRDGGWRRFYTACFNPAWGQFSPGLALIAEVTRRSLAEGLDCDYMTGEQPHKMRLATGKVPLYRVEASVADLQAFAHPLSVAAAEEPRLAA